jgi:hypothetical protein
MVLREIRRPWLIVVLIAARSILADTSIIINPPTDLPEDVAVADLRGLIYLLLALGVFTFSLVLLRHAMLMLKSVATHDGRLATASAVLCTLVGIGLGLLWCVAISDLRELGDDYVLLLHPRLFIPGVLIAAALPGALAVLKFVAAVNVPNPNSMRAGAAWGGLIAFINLVASVATLVTFALTFRS